MPFSAILDHLLCPPGPGAPLACGHNKESNSAMAGILILLSAPGRWAMLSVESCQWLMLGILRINRVLNNILKSLIRS